LCCGRHRLYRMALKQNHHPCKGTNGQLLNDRDSSQGTDTLACGQPSTMPIPTDPCFRSARHVHLSQAYMRKTYFKSTNNCKGWSFWGMYHAGRDPKVKLASNGTMQLPEYSGMSPASGGTAPGTLASERRLKMPSIARRPLFIST